MPPEILGPTGLLIAALAAVAILWREKVKADLRVQKDSDDWKAIALASQATVTRLTDLVEHAFSRDRE